MSSLNRFGVSLEQALLLKFDRYLKTKSYTNRSEAIRDLIRKTLVAEEWTENKEVAGAITLIYDHHRRELVQKLTAIQHDFGDIIISSQHVHLDHHNCLEIVAVKGRAHKAKQLSDRLQSARGVKHTSFAMATTGRAMI